MSKTPNYDAKIKAILDATRPGERTCALTGQKWELTAGELEWCWRFLVPPSTIHPFVRMKILFAYNSALSLWRKPHAITGEPILSYIHPDNQVKVVTDAEWMSLDQSSQGRSVDVSQPFFDQLYQRYLDTSFRALATPGDSVNTIGFGMHKCLDSFMIFASLDIERSSYVEASTSVRDSVDVTNSLGGIAESSSINRCRSLYNCHVAFECHDCLNSWFLFDCRNCEYCFGATNQRNKKYLWFNEQLTKEEWERRREAVGLSSYAIFERERKRFFDLVAGSVWPETFNIAAGASTGEYLEETVRVLEGYQLQKVTDCFRVWFAVGSSDCAYQTGSGFGSEIWQTSGAAYSQNVKFSHNLTRCEDVEYCVACMNCSHCFGCVNLNRKQYCILNKQYTEQDYWRTLDDLKCVMLERGEYGKSVPGKMSIVGMPFSAAALLLGISKEEIELFGGEIYDAKRGMSYMPAEVDPGHRLTPEALPDRLEDATGLVNRAVWDPAAGRSYPIMPRDFDFAERHHLPLPRKHFLSRLQELNLLSNVPETIDRACASCGKGIKVYRNNTFSTRRVLCEACYLAYLESRG